MIGKAQAARQPSIDELLASIRQAIHERVESDGPAGAAGKAGTPTLVHSRPEPVTGPATGAAPRVSRPERVTRGQERHGDALLKAFAGRQGPDEAPVASPAEAPVEKRAAAASRTSQTGASRPEHIPAANGQDNFAGLLGGDVRLEEALARLHKTGPQPGAKAPCAAAEHVAASPEGNAAPQARPIFRPTIDELAGGRTPPGPASQKRPTPAVTDAAEAESARLRLARPEPARPEPARPEPARQVPIGAKPAKADFAPHRRAEHAGDAARPGLNKPPSPDRRDELWQEGQAAPCPPERPTATASSAGSDGPNDLLSSQAAEAAHSAFDRLAGAVGGRSPGGERTLDEITRECLRPLLKAWLDENLPGLVERLVRDEIARIARPAR